MGTGILDIARLLDQPISGSLTRGSVPRPALTDIPLWRSLYPDTTDHSQSTKDYRQLFRLKAVDKLEDVAIFEVEITHHYAMNESVADALDAIVVYGAQDDAAFELSRDLLLGEDLSSTLRSALQ